MPSPPKRAKIVLPGSTLLHELNTTSWKAEENRRKLVLNRWIYVRKALEAIHSDIPWQLHTTRPTESWKISLWFSVEVNVAWLWACCGGALVLSPFPPWKSLRVFLNALYRACYRCYKRSFSREIWEYRNCERDKDAYFGCGMLYIADDDGKRATIFST